MDTLEAVDALRTLDALSIPRRQYLCTVVATAPTNGDRARIVMVAKRENTERRRATEQGLRAELDARRTAESHTPQGASQVPSRSSQRVVRTDETAPAHRPVTIRFVKPTKVGKEASRRPEAIGKNHSYAEPAEPTTPAASSGTAKPIKHGVSTGYQRGCRCDDCRAAKARSRKGVGRVRRANGEVCHGSTTQYSRGCRCQPCRDAVAAYARNKRAEMRLGNSGQ